MQRSDIDEDGVFVPYVFITYELQRTSEPNASPNILFLHSGARIWPLSHWKWTTLSLRVQPFAN